MLSVGLAAMALATSASAQLDGPAPLAWRWVGSASVSPTGTPLVLGNIVYVAVGSRIYALDKDTGNQKWKFPQVEPIDGSFRTEPIKVGSLLVAAADNKSVYALDPATGEKKWQYLALAPILGQPIALGDRQVGIAMSDNTLLVLNAETGVALWAGPQKIFDGIAGRISSFQNNILVMTQTNNLMSIDGTSGKTSWSKNFTDLNSDSRAVVYGDGIYINSNSFVVCLNAASGSYRWDRDAGDAIPFAPAVSPDGVAVATRDGKIVVFDTASGRRVTHQETDPVTKRPSTVDSVDLGSYPLTSPSAVGHEFVFPTTSGTLTMFDPRTGRLLWNYTIKPLTKGSADPTATTGGGTIGGGGRSPSGGGSSPRTTPAPTSVPAAGPAILAGETLLVLAKDGSLLAFDRMSGVDLTPPTVEMTFPKPGDQVSSKSLEIHFQLDDEASGLRSDSVTVSVDGKMLDYKLARDGEVTVRFSMSGKNGLMTDGRHVFTINSTDWLGNSSTSTFALTVDNNLPPLGAPPANNNNPGRGGGAGGGGRGN